MVTHSLKEYIKEIIIHFFEQDPKDVEDSDTLTALGAGEIYLVEELVCRLEDVFGIQFYSGENITEGMTVNEVAEFVLRKKLNVK